jgi:lysophospholipase
LQENVPLDPFLVAYRAVDAIIAMDNSADTNYSWPNGSSLHVSYRKALDQENTYNLSSRMPQVPSTNGFINGGYNTRPTFFGCNDANDTVLIVYIPNAPWSTYSNTSTFQLAYPTNQAVAMVDNGRRTLDLNGTVSECLTCALMDRATTVNGTARSSICQSCFDTWCWKGDDNTTTPAPYTPVLGALPSFLQNLTGTSPSSGGDIHATIPRVLLGLLMALVGASTVLL